MQGEQNFITLDFSKALGSSLQAELYSKTHEYSEKSGVTLLSGPLVALGSALITIVRRVSAVAETAIKGTAILFLTPFHSKCHFIDAASQLIVKLPLDLVALAITPVDIALSSVITTLALLKSPQSYSKFRKKVHTIYAEASGTSYDEIRDKMEITNSKVDIIARFSLPIFRKVAGVVVSLKNWAC